MITKDPVKTSYKDEDELQSMCYQWTTYNFPNATKTYFHINQKSKNGIEGNQMKAKGVVKGVADTCLLTWNGATHWIEFKTLTGTQSPDQIIFENQCKKLGHIYIIIRTFETFKSYYLKHAPINL